MENRGAYLLFSKISVFDRKNIAENVDVVTIYLDATLQSDLDWREAREAALNYSEQGLRIFWELDFGLFSRLQFPLSDEGQYRAFLLSISHFLKTLWKPLRQQTMGIALYRGSVDFSLGHQWDNGIGMEHQLHFRDQAAEFLDLLARELPEEVDLFLLLDRSGYDDPIHVANLLNRECFSRFHFVIEGFPHFPSFVAYMGREEMSPLALCLPPKGHLMPQHYGLFRRAFQALLQKDSNFRLIPESHLTTEWEELDELVVVSQHLSTEGVRKLMGFCAAGGRVVHLGPALGLACEISFDDWKKMGSNVKD